MYLTRSLNIDILNLPSDISKSMFYSAIYGVFNIKWFTAYN
jgi:hypothetical protein